MSIASPISGDYSRRGALWVFGEACDPNAAMTDLTAGIAKVSVYVGDRDTTEGVPSWRPGGYLSSASTIRPSWDSPFAQSSRLGLANTDVSICKQPNAGFRVLTPSLRKGTWTLNVYVLASNGKETKVPISNLRIDMP